MPSPQWYSAESITLSGACRERKTVWIRNKGEVFRKIKIWDVFTEKRLKRRMNSSAAGGIYRLSEERENSSPNSKPPVELVVCTGSERVSRHTRQRVSLILKRQIALRTCKTGTFQSLKAVLILKFWNQVILCFYKILLKFFLPPVSPEDLSS